MGLALTGAPPVRTRPFPGWPLFDESEEDSLIDVLKSGRWGGYSERIAEFESAFATLHQMRYAVSCANGTVALELALRAAGISCGDEVIVPAITFISTATSVLLCHGVPIFADIDPQTLNLCPAEAERLITRRTRAIIVVHFGGHPADMDAFQEIAKRHGIALIEDAAHAHGAIWRGCPVGNFGLAATFSFQSFKLITSGEGGIVLTNSQEIANKVWSYCNQGRQKDRGWYEHFTLGTNYRLTGFQAAILMRQLARLTEQTCKREENIAYFRDQLRSAPAFVLSKPDPRVDRHPNYLITLRYRAAELKGVLRDTIIRGLRAEGIPAEPFYPHPLYRNPLFTDTNLPPCQCGRWHASQDYRTLQLPESERICSEGIWLPHNIFLGTRDDVDDVLEALYRLQQNAAALIDFERMESALERRP